MFNWRQYCIRFLVATSGSGILKNFKYIKSLEDKNEDELTKIQNEKLKKILLHAQTNCPYYSKILYEYGVVKSNKVILDNFCNLPILTKNIIRKEFNQLLSHDRLHRNAYSNTSGGSTGEPVQFIQDKQYSDWNIANKIYYKYTGGQNLGDREIRLWGSERDIIEGKEKLSIRIRNWIYNRFDFNSFRIEESDFDDLVQTWNVCKPTWIEAYVQSIFEFAKYIKKNEIKIHFPKGILTSAGILSPEIRSYLESMFNCKVYNRYGSREVGDIACNCKEDDKLHLSIWNHYVEVLDDNMQPIFNKAGKIHITTLNNYSMPLIRYEIGDIGVMEKDFKQCKCNRIAKNLTSIQGRTVNFFKTNNGGLVDGEYFTHLFYFRPWIKKFQVVQNKINTIECNVVLNGEKNQEDIFEIENKIKKIMSIECIVRWNFVTEIQNSSSGKFLYTICNI